jgi:hypothetical protein
MRPKKIETCATYMYTWLPIEQQFWGHAQLIFASGLKDKLTILTIYVNVHSQ